MEGAGSRFQPRPDRIGDDFQAVRASFPAGWRVADVYRATAVIFIQTERVSNSTLPVYMMTTIVFSLTSAVLGA